MPLRFPGNAKLSPFAVALICVIGALNGCKKKDDAIIVRAVPKQPAPSSQPTTMGVMPDEMAAVSAPEAKSSNGQVSWNLPQGWKELPGDGEIRYATIQVDPAHPDLVLTVIPLEGDSGGMLANVNRWRGELTLPAISQSDLAGNVSQMDLNGAKVYKVDLLAPESVNPRTATLAAAVPHGNRTWFFKLKGLAENVTPQKEKFDAFINTVDFADSNEPKDSKPQAAAANAPNSDPLRYEMPAGWVKGEPQPMRTVSFHIGEGSEKVDIIVSQLPAGSSGTELDNINRWRAQVGLPAIGQGEMPASQPVKVGGRDGVLFDFMGPAQSSPARRQVVARVTYGNNFWFFKMIGNDPQVRQQQANFDRFLQSVQFIAASAPAAKP